MGGLAMRAPRVHDLFDIRRDFDEVFNRFLNWRWPSDEQHLTEGFMPAVETRIESRREKILLPSHASRC
jgi:hypothetical protein